MSKPSYPPLPEKRRRMFCTKCRSAGATQAMPPSAPCDNPKCGYMAFVEFCEYSDDEMHAYYDLARAAQAVSVSDEREKFEKALIESDLAFMKSKVPDVDLCSQHRFNVTVKIETLARNPDGSYLNEDTAARWEGWQARAALAQPEQPDAADCDGGTCGLGGYCDKCALPTPQPADAGPVAWLFQHDETGRMTCVANDGMNTPEVFARLNPRQLYVGPAYAAPQQAPLTDEQRKDLLKVALFVSMHEHTRPVLKPGESARWVDLLMELSGYDLTEDGIGPKEAS